MIEMFKSWGKMHDPKTDSRINFANYCIDRVEVFNGDMGNTKLLSVS